MVDIEPANRVCKSTKITTGVQPVSPLCWNGFKFHRLCRKKDHDMSQKCVALTSFPNRNRQRYTAAAAICVWYRKHIQERPYPRGKITNGDLTDSLIV